MDGFQDRTKAINQFWQTDFTYLKDIDWGRFYLSTILDDYSRYIISSLPGRCLRANAERGKYTSPRRRPTMSSTRLSWRCRHLVATMPTSGINHDRCPIMVHRTSLMTWPTGSKISRWIMSKEHPIIRKSREKSPDGVASNVFRPAETTASSFEKPRTSDKLLFARRSQCQHRRIRDPLQ